MSCEVCKAIERLGLAPAAHDLWFCPDGKAAARKAWMTSPSKAHRRRRPSATRMIRRQFRRAINAFASSLPAQRQHYVTLCLR